MFTKTIICITALLLTLASLPARSQSLTTLHAFAPLNAAGINADGAHPYAALVQGADGNWYGTAVDGGPNGTGTVFRVSPAGALAVLYAFEAESGSLGTNAHGAHPYASLLLARDGSFYGSTAEGGAHGTGTLFRLTQNLAGAWTLTTLHSFGPFDGSGFRNPDGAHPYAALIQGANGSFYGTAPDGGSGTGTVFQMTPAGALTVPHKFKALNYPNDVTNPGGAFPYAALVQESDGSLCGSASQGGGAGNGVIFRVALSGAYTLLHEYAHLKYGVNPGGANAAGLVLISGGTLYGTSFYGGSGGAGTIFQRKPDGTLTVLHNFGVLDYRNANTDGAMPNPPVFAGDGALYGTTSAGGANGDGTIYRMATDGTFTLLQTLSPATGTSAESALAQSTDGALYGTASRGGPNDTGVVFRLSLPSASVMPGRKGGR